VKENPKLWGLTIKAVPYSEKKKSTTHVWKYSWCKLEEGEFLDAAKHCKSVTNAITGEAYQKIKLLYEIYKK
jgi:predicted MarR family transcription regulator